MLNKAMVIVSVDAEDEFHFYKQLNEFLRNSFREFAATHNIQDYEILVTEK
jgi:hypothetical protein